MANNNEESTLRYIVHSTLYGLGYLSEINEKGHHEYSPNKEDAKFFSFDDIEDLYPDLEMDHPLSETSIIDVGIERDLFNLNIDDEMTDTEAKLTL